MIDGYSFLRVKKVTEHPVFSELIQLAGMKRQVDSTRKAVIENCDEEEKEHGPTEVKRDQTMERRVNSGKSPHLDKK